jgi:hypothetical protein
MVVIVVTELVITIGFGWLIGLKSKVAAELATAVHTFEVPATVCPPGFVATTLHVASPFAERTPLSVIAQTPGPSTVVTEYVKVASLSYLVLSDPWLVVICIVEF